MKHVLIFSLLFSLCQLSNASVPRKPLVEELTSTTCSYCDLSDSVVDAYCSARAGKICVLKWFTRAGNYPGENPFYNAYPQAEKRWNYYGGPGVPQFRGNGANPVNPYHGTEAIDAAFTNTIYYQTSPFAMQVFQQIIDDSLECTVHVTLVDAAFNMIALRLGIVISEREISFQENTTFVKATSTHTNVVRGTIPEFENGAPAIALPPMTQDQTIIFTYRIAIDSLWNKDMLLTTAFIQDVNTQEVFQSEMSASPATVFANHQPLNAIVYPNPSTGIVYVSYTSELPVIFSIYDVSGNKVFQDVMSNQAFSIDASQLASGSYSLRMQAGEIIKIKRMILRR